MSELKPCPFCGSDDAYKFISGDDCERECRWITCGRCEADGPISDDPVTAWNTRLLAVPISRLRELLGSGLIIVDGPWGPATGKVTHYQIDYEAMEALIAEYSEQQP